MARAPAKAPKRKRVAAANAAPGIEAPAAESPVAASIVADSAVPAAEPVVESTATSGAAAITLAANCSIKEVAVLRSQLCAVVDSGEPVAIDASAVERIDTATLQLLYAFVRDRLNSDREVTWQGVPAALTDAARLLGVRDLLCLPAAAC
ncbi:MAG TPA: STAS domain-containing protein [Povalibacter sp.]|uniref:STAS domain-containing protein n=1 Tax=Povalibacter sp. TaxID=1962978 RepID=UPI002B8FEA4C|nr:STAS domain-containing protein [Povalibacter sp.]HMN44399.1 STAS domain-containing protein [Povalibacter sp.]